MVMRSTAMDLLNLLVGDWQVAMHEAWFLDQPDVDDAGTASIEWLGDAFLSFHWRAPVGDTRLVIGRSDAADRYQVLYHDERGTSRVFAMTFDGSTWTMVREDPDFHQRWTATVGPGLIEGRWEASDDAGDTWRTDYRLVLTAG